MTRHHCLFCNSSSLQGRVFVKQLSESIEIYNDQRAMNYLGTCYKAGKCGFSADHSKAAQLYRRACDVGGSALAHINLAQLYFSGKGVGLNTKKAVHHFQMAAMMGNDVARYTLGHLEEKIGNMVCAMRHFMIGAKSGCDRSLEKVKEGFGKRIVSKDDLEKILRAHKAAQDETKSEQRDTAEKFTQMEDVAKNAAKSLSTRLPSC